MRPVYLSRGAYLWVEGGLEVDGRDDEGQRIPAPAIKEIKIRFVNKIWFMLDVPVCFKAEVQWHPINPYILDNI